MDIYIYIYCRLCFIPYYTGNAQKQHDDLTHKQHMRKSPENSMMSWLRNSICGSYPETA